MTDAKLRIKKVEIRNVLNFVDPGELQFSERTLITGDNAVGKTNLFRAIIWALFGDIKELHSVGNTASHTPPTWPLNNSTLQNLSDGQHAIATVELYVEFNGEDGLIKRKYTFINIKGTVTKEREEFEIWCKTTKNAPLLKKMLSRGYKKYLDTVFFDGEYSNWAEHRMPKKNKEYLEYIQKRTSDPVTPMIRSHLMAAGDKQILSILTTLFNRKRSAIAPFFLSEPFSRIDIHHQNNLAKILSEERNIVILALLHTMRANQTKGFKELFASFQCWEIVQNSDGNSVFIKKNR